MDSRDVRLESQPFAVGGSGQVYKGAFADDIIVAKVRCPYISINTTEVI